MLFDDLLRDREAEARPFDLGRVVRLEDPLDVFDAGAVVLDPDRDAARLALREEAQRAARLAHRLERVVDHVQQHALDLVGVRLHLGSVRGELDLDAQLLGRGFGVGRERVEHQRVRVEPLGAHRRQP